MIITGGQACCCWETGRQSSSTWGCRETRQEMCTEEKMFSFPVYMHRSPLLVSIVLLLLFCCCSCIVLLYKAPRTYRAAIWRSSQTFLGKKCRQTPWLLWIQVWHHFRRVGPTWSHHVSLSKHLQQAWHASSSYLGTRGCICLNGMGVGGIASAYYRWHE